MPIKISSNNNHSNINAGGGDSNRYSVQSAYLSAIKAKSSNNVVTNENAYSEYRATIPITNQQMSNNSRANAPSIPITNQQMSNNSRANAPSKPITNQQMSNNSRANAPSKPITNQQMSNNSRANAPSIPITNQQMSNNSRVNAPASTASAAIAKQVSCTNKQTINKKQTTTNTSTANPGTTTSVLIANSALTAKPQTRSQYDVTTTTIGRYGDPEEKSPPVSASDHAINGSRYSVQSRYLAAIQLSKSKSNDMQDNVNPTAVVVEHTPHDKPSIATSTERSVHLTAHTAPGHKSTLELKREYLQSRSASKSKSKSDNDKTPISASNNDKRNVQSIYLSALKPSPGHNSSIELQKEYLMVSKSISNSHDDEGMGMKVVSHDDEGIGVGMKNVSHDDEGMGMKVVSHDDEGIGVGMKNVSHDDEGMGMKVVSREEKCPASSATTTIAANSKKNSVQSIYLSALNLKSDTTATLATGTGTAAEFTVKGVVQPCSSNDSYGLQSLSIDGRSIQLPSSDTADGDMYALRVRGSNINSSPNIAPSSSSGSKVVTTATPTIVVATASKGSTTSGIAVLRRGQSMDRTGPTCQPHGMNTLLTQGTLATSSSGSFPGHDDILNTLESEIVTLMRSEGWSRETAVRILLAKTSSGSPSKATPTQTQQQPNNNNNNNKNNNNRPVVKEVSSLHTSTASNDKHVARVVKAAPPSSSNASSNYSTSNAITSQPPKGREPLSSASKGQMQYQQHQHPAVENASMHGMNRVFDHQPMIRQMMQESTNHSKQSKIAQGQQSNKQNQHMYTTAPSSSTLMDLYKVSAHGQGHSPHSPRSKIPRPHPRFAVRDDGPDWDSLSTLSLSGSEYEEGTVVCHHRFVDDDDDDGGGSIDGGDKKIMMIIMAIMMIYHSI